MSDLPATVVDAETVARVILHGDLSKLTPSQKVSYYNRVCDSVGLNPLTKPFAYITLNGKEVLYALREATEQLRKLHKVSIVIVARELVEETQIVTARATLPDGRTDESVGAVWLGGLKGQMRADKIMGCETKAKRRVTLSIIGLGMLDETEVETLPPSATAPPKLELPPSNVVSAPESDLPAGYVRVVHVNSGPTNNPNVTKWWITLSTGEELTTIKSWLASLAEQYRDGRTPVRVKRKTKQGTDLLALMPLSDVETPPEPVPLDADIPF